MENNRPYNYNSSGNNNPGGSFSYGVNRPQPSTPTPSPNNNDDRLKKLQQQLNQSSDDKQKKKRRKGIIIWIILILLLIGVAVGAIILFSKGSGELDLGGTIRLSVDVDETGGSSLEESISVKKVYPGNSFPVTVQVRNANSFSGDSDAAMAVPIFVRYKVELVVGDKTYNNVIIPTVQRNNWCIYDPQTETKEWDGYYYYYGQVVSQESIALFTAVTFDFANTTNEMAGKIAEIKITVDAVEGNGQNIGGSEAWGSAPDAWINYVQQNFGE